MPNKARDHSESRKVVCATCLNKAIKGRKINATLEGLIKNLIPEFSVENPIYPSVVCVTCAINLKKQKKILTVSYEFINTNQENPLCHCEICNIARSNNHDYKKKNIAISREVGRPGNSNSPKKNLVVCSKCLNQVGKGKPHQCNIRNKISNVLNTISEQQQEQVASKILNNISNTTINSKVLELKRDRGAPMKVRVLLKKDVQNQNSNQINENTLYEIQKKTGAIMKTLTTVVREVKKIGENIFR